MKKSQLQKKISGWDKNVDNLSTQLDDLKYKFSSVSREKRSVETSNTISNKKRQELEKRVHQLETEVVSGYNSKVSIIKLLWCILPILYNIILDLFYEDYEFVWVFKFWGIQTVISLIYVSYLSLNKNRRLKKINKPLETKIKTQEGKRKTYDKHEYERLKNRIEGMNIEISKLKLYSKNSKNLIELKEKYDKDDNLVLDIIESTHIDKLVKNQQSTIRNIEKSENKSYIPDLVKINLFLNDYQKSLEIEFKNLQKNVEDKVLNDSINVFIRDVEFYRVLISNLIIMIDHLVKDDLIGYYKIRDMFDKLSIFESNYEKKLISELIGVRTVTKELIDVTYKSQQIISEQLDSIDISLSLVSDEIRDINNILLK